MLNKKGPSICISEMNSTKRNIFIYVGNANNTLSSNRACESNFCWYVKGSDKQGYTIGEKVPLLVLCPLQTIPPYMAQ